GWKLVSASHVVQGGSGRVSDCICLLLFVSSKLLNRTTAGYAESNACGDTSSAVRRSAQEPAEAISQNQRVAVGILSVQGEEDVNSAPAPSLYDEGDENERNRLFPVRNAVGCSNPSFLTSLPPCIAFAGGNGRSDSRQ